MCGWFTVDVVLNLNTSFWNKGRLIMKRQKIMIHYLKTWLIFDICACIPYSISYADSENIVTIMKLIMLLSLSRIQKMDRLIQTVSPFFFTLSL
jgi:hypothetical protein